MIALKLLAVATLIALNALFTAAQVSLTIVRHSRIRTLADAGDPRARVAQQLIADPDRVVSGACVGITMATLGLGFFGATTLATLLRQAIGWLPGEALEWLPQGLAITLAFLAMIALHAILGDLVPRMLSLHRAEQMALSCARPFRFYLFAFALPIRILDRFAVQFVRWLGVKASSGQTMLHSMEELQTIVEQAGRRGILKPEEEHLILGAVELGTVQVREIMIARPQMHLLPASAGIDEVMRTFATTQRSRIPVFDGSPDQILGMIHIKDMLWVLLDRERRVEQGMPPPAFDLRRILREVLIVPETKPASELLLELRAHRAGIAMVVDEHGSILGLVALEDVLEEMVGEIHDEFDVVERPLTFSDGTLILDASLKVRDLHTRYGIALRDDPAYETIGGFVLTQLGFLPKGGESIDVDPYRFTVLEMERRRVARIKVQRLRAPVPDLPATPSSDSPAVESSSKAATE